MSLDTILEKARMTLKALKGGEEKPPVVPEAPADPDRIDPRAEGASPTEESLDEASEEGDEKGEGEGGDFDEHGHQDMKPEELGKESEKPGEKDGEEEEEEEQEDPEGRPATKSFPHVGHLFPDEGDLTDLDEGSKGMAALFGEFMKVLGKQNSVLEQMSQRLADLEKGITVNHEAMGRDVKKALESSGAAIERLDRLHETAPAASAPRAVQKSLADPAGGPQGLGTADVMTLAASKKMTPLEISMLCQNAGRN